MLVPQPSTLAEARLFVGTTLERRFSTRQYTGWYPCSIAEVNTGADLGMQGEEAQRLWCLLRYEPEGDDPGDTEDQDWVFVFDMPNRCRNHLVPPAAFEWLQSPAAAAAAIAAAAAAAQVQQQEEQEQQGQQAAQVSGKSAPASGKRRRRACTIAAPTPLVAGSAQPVAGASSPQDQQAGSSRQRRRQEDRQAPASGMSSLDALATAAAAEPARPMPALAGVSARGAPPQSSTGAIADAVERRTRKAPAAAASSKKGGGGAAAGQLPPARRAAMVLAAAAATPLPAAANEPVPGAVGGIGRAAALPFAPRASVDECSSVPAQQPLAAAFQPLDGSSLPAVFEALELMEAAPGEASPEGLSEQEVQAFKLLLLREKEQRQLMFQELRRLVLRGSIPAAAGWVRGCVAELGRTPLLAGAGGGALSGAAHQAAASKGGAPHGGG